MNGLQEAGYAFGFEGEADGRGSWGSTPAVRRPARERTVLVVDDSACSRAALSALLATVPRTQVVAVARDGTEALREVEAHTPDVVVLDVRMPGMDGIEVTRRIKALAPATRVILLTVCAAYRDEGLAAGADRFLVKGGPVEELIEAIETVTAGPSETPAGACAPGETEGSAARTGFSASILVGRVLLRLGYPV